MGERERERLSMKERERETMERDREREAPIVESFNFIISSTNKMSFFIFPNIEIFKIFEVYHLFIYLDRERAREREIEREKFLKVYNLPITVTIYQLPITIYHLPQPKNFHKKFKMNFFYF